MAKKSGKTKGQKRTPSNRGAGSGSRAAARSGGGTRRTKKASRNTGRRTAGARTPAGKAARRITTAGAAAQGRAKKRTLPAGSQKRRQAAGGTGRERELAQTPEAGRTVRGRTNPMPTKRSTSARGASSRLKRTGRALPEVEENVPTPPSSLNLNRSASAARSGRRELLEHQLEHTETGPVLTGGDIDANWEDAYSVGSEAPGGDNPTPDQDRVDDIGKALGVEYQDNEELKSADKIAQRDRRRWELDPASSDDYRDREK
jgi:hypothetical protein